VHENAKVKVSDRRAAKAESKRRVSYGQGTVADWTSAESQLVVAAIAAISLAGGAIRFGYTRDGGAYAIGILGDGEPYTEYVRPSEDINAYLAALVEQWRN